MGDREQSLRVLSQRLSEASSIISTLIQSPAPSRTPPVSRPSIVPSVRTNATTDVGTALNRARSMISQSMSNGSFTRLNRRERLRATSNTANSCPPEKKKKEDEVKVFEFVVMDIRETEEDIPWSISEDKVIVRGLFEIKQSSKEAEIRREIGKATRMKYGTVTDDDFVFLRATRRKLSKPVNCGAFDYKQLKLLTGQGSVYLKLKDWIYCLLKDDNTDDDNELMNSAFNEHDATSTSQNGQTQNETLGATSTSTPSPVNYQTTFLSEGQHEIQHDLTRPGTVPEVDIIGGGDDLKAINDLAEQIVAFCKEHDITNPIEILRHFQKVMVYGRPLQVENVSQVVEGVTNFILVDRFNILETAFDEIKSLTDLRKTLEVQFYGEEAEDYGGPRKEFFSLILREIYGKYFEHSLKDHLAEDYCTIGIILGLSILQNGKIPQFLGEDYLTDIFAVSSKDSTHPQTCLDYLRLGFKKVGIYQVVSQLPIFLYLLRPTSKSLTFKSIVQLLKPEFSAEGSNSRRYENAVYTTFQKYLREVSSGRRAGLALSNILQFATGADEEPVLGFGTGPTLTFYEVEQSFLPTANTCVCCLKLPRPSLEKALPDNEQLFSLYDLAFLNAYFGNR